MTDLISTDILVSGGGIAGLIAAAGFGAQGQRVLCVDPAPPVTQEGTGADMRTTAFLQPSVALLRRIGLWDRLAPFAAPLQIMRIVEGDMSREFDASEISDEPFGYNLPNWLIRREILARIDEFPGVTFRPGTGTATLLARDDAALVTLTDGTRVAARLVVAADGRDSPVRKQLGIGVRTTRYGQRALAFGVTHDAPHNNISTEVHRSGGPFTLVPLPDRDGKPASGVVWMDNGPAIERLRALPPDAFVQALNDRSLGVLGHLTPATPLGEYPIISQIADRFSGPRTALIAEAAHVVPPIGAQGLNMSLADLATLLDLSLTAPGSSESLRAYDRARRPDAVARLTGIDALNRASIAGAAPLRRVRAAALAALFALPPVRHAVMRAGLGLR